MGKKLKAISKVSVALALLGAAVPAVEATPTAMAAKKSTKKSVKKSTKKAKKAKKSTKKKAPKKVAKKTGKKKATKKSVKKVAKKKVVKKTAKKAAPKKTTSKKTTKKVVKKATAKKPVKKVAKKTTTKQPAQKVVKRLTMADKYQPQVKSGTVNLKWGTDVTDDWDYEARKFITNDSSIPVSTSYKYLDPVNGQKGGTYTTRIQVTYADGSKEVVGSVTFVVPTTDVDKYQPTVHDVTLEYGADYSIRKDFITNPAGYFPNDPIFSQFKWSSDRTHFDLYTDSEKSFSVTEPGTYTVHVMVTYPDRTYEDTNKFKITVLPSQAETIKVAPKASSFTVSSSSALEYHDDDLGDTLVDPSFFLTNVSSLPKGTVVRFNGSLDSTDTLDPGKYEDYLTIKFPDGSSYDTDNFIVNVK